MSKCKIKILAVFNQCTETTIPLENFANLDSDMFEKHVLSFHQSQTELKKMTSNAYLGKNLCLHGLEIKRFSPYNILKSVSILLEEKPHIIHVNHSLSGLIASVLGSLVSKAKIVVTVHSNYKFYTKTQKLLFLWTYMLSDLIVCNSRNTRDSIEKLSKRFFPKTPTMVIYNGIDTQKIIHAKHAPSSFFEKPKCFTIGTVGRLVPAKDYETLIKGFALFNKVVNNSVLILIGDGPLRQELTQLVEELGITEKVVFYGLAKRTIVYEMLNCFDLFVVSSKWEGFCNAMVEAMVSGVPVLSSDVQPLPEVLGRDNGLFFAAGDANSLYDNMVYCYNKRNDLKKLAEKARDYAKANYSLTSCVNYYEDAYKTFARK